MMKTNRTVSTVAGFALLIFVIQGCSISTANLSDLKTSKDEAGKDAASTFKSGDTLYGNATVSNNIGKVKVTLHLAAEDVEGIEKGETLKGSEVSVDIDGDGVAKYNVPVTEGFLPGSYKLTADMMNEAGEKKDTKSVTVTITGKPAADMAEPKDADPAGADSEDGEPESDTSEQ